MRLLTKLNCQKQRYKRYKYLQLNSLLVFLLLQIFAYSGDRQISVRAGTITNGNSEFTRAQKANASISNSGIDPERIIISAIDVNAKVIDLGLNPNGTLEVPTNYAEAGWWSGGSQPGETGSAVIAGHVDSKTDPAVFYDLQQLMPGDLIQVVDRDGRVVNFEVERLKQVSKDNFPTREVYGMTSSPTLRLVTCGGKFNRSSGHYLDNVIVFASVVEN